MCVCWLTNVDGMKDQWCSSTVRLLLNTDMNGKIYGALVQFSCCQHSLDMNELVTNQELHVHVHVRL